MTCANRASSARSARRVAAFVGMLIGVLCLEARAASPVPELVQGNRWAVVVAIERYPESAVEPNPDIERLFGPLGVAGSEGIAHALADVLRTQYGYGEDRILTLVNDGATRKDIYRLQSELREKVGAGDSVLVVILAAWVGPRSGVPAMLPFDGVVDEPWTHVAYAELLELMSASRAATVQALFEVCPSRLGTGADLENLLGQMTSKQAPQVGRTPPSVIAGCRTKSLIFSPDLRTKPEETFIHHVVEQLRAWQPGRTGESLRAEELIARVQKSAQLEVARVNPTRRSSTFAFQRESGGLDSQLEARILNRSANLDSRIDALNKLASTLALDAPGSARRTAAEGLLTNLYADGTEELPMRAAAIGYAGQLKAAASVMKLQALTQNAAEPTELRVAAVEALAQIGDPPSITALLGAIESPTDDVRAAAISAAAVLAPSEALEPILEQLKNREGRDTVTAALRALQRMGAPAEKTLPSVIAVADSDFDATARREAIRLLGSYGAEEAFQPLADILRGASQPVLVRQDAAYALGKLKLSDANRALAGELLLQVLGEDSLRLQIAAADSIGRLNIVEARPRLESLLRNDRTAAMRAAAASSLAQLKQPESRAALEAAVLKDSEPSVRRAAAIALGEIGNEQSIPVLNRVLSDKGSTEEVRLAASQAIDSIGARPSSSEYWERTLRQSKDPLERARAIGQLPPRGDAALAAMLIEYLGDPSYEVRQAALAKIVTLPGVAVIRELAAVIQRPNDLTAVGTAGALGEFGRTAKPGSEQWTEALAILARQPAERSPTVRAAVIRALGWFADKGAIVAIGSLTRGDDRQVVFAAADAYRAMGESFFKADKAAEAVEVGRRALEMRQSVMGELHPEVATELNNLGVYLVLAQNDKDAERHLQRALLIRERALGPNDPETAVTLSNLGALYRRRGDFKQAEPLWLRVLSIRERALRPGDPLLAQTFDNVSALYRDMGDAGRAEKYQQRGEYLRRDARK